MRPDVPFVLGKPGRRPIAIAALVALAACQVWAQGTCGKFPAPGFDGPDMRPERGTVTNPNYDFSVTVPPGLTGYAAPAPFPYHGFGIVLCWEPRAYLWVDGSYNSSEYKSPREAAQQHLKWERKEVGSLLFAQCRPAHAGGCPATHLVCRYVCADNATRRVLHEVFFIRKQGGIIYEVGLDTTQSREKEDLVVFEQILSSWKMTPPE
jgi:hypothetical protein